ncbi:LamG-like jellyroll fold domain-containing protein [Pedosphaera parvula]|uniref:Immunoglobulin I-set domain protein n=1 Tax=Pedosphaera parvula (strain Ellin514) TaxID=320771 RepID=B9XAJ5_PEDPL|nr:LamG-like jellyroll fold domain-containing protein [Pedosphaera parvula]EEF63030.1 hypothetical protein Cflav_PD5665 [Pedosphaera parvula Ellin514]
MIVPTAQVYSRASTSQPIGIPLIISRPGRRGLLGLLIVAALFYISMPARAGTVALWKFDAANPAADSSGNGNNLALNGNITFSGDAPTNAPGITNSVIFDGASYAQTIGTLNLTPYNQLTIEFFAKFTVGGGLQMFFAQNNPNNVTGAFYLDRGESSASGLKMSQRTAAGFETDVAPGPTEGAWHHYALTIDESGTNPIVKIYVDGYQVDTGGVSAGLQTFINDYFTIGAYPPAYNLGYHGLMGEMRISSSILPSPQFLIGAQTPRIFISQQPQNTAVVTNSPATFKVVATVQNGDPTPPLQYQWQRNGSNIPDATNSSYTLSAPTLSDNAVQFDVVLSALGAASVTSSNVTLTVATNSVVAFWKFDAANPTVDSSGYGNNLALTGNITFSNDAPTNAPGSTNSAVFDGASYARTLGTFNLSLYNQLTIEFYAKYTIGGGLQMFFAQNNPNNVLGAFYFDRGESSATGLKVAQKTATSGIITGVAPGPSDEAWHHYALTMDESGTNPVFQVYVDGYLVGTGGAGGQGLINDFFTIGAYPPSYNFRYQGLMSEMRVSSGVLTPAQFLIGAQIPRIFISQQPQNTAVVTNSPATFMVVASVQNGTQSLHYQWQRNGVNIAGATNSSYTLSATTLTDDSAQFDVVLSTPPAMPVTSSNAVLTVVTNATVALWTFDAANPAVDSSGNGNDLTLVGNITISDDVSINAPGTTNSVVFDGGSLAQTTQPLDLTRYNQLTVEFFAKYSINGGLQMFFAQNNPNFVAGAFYLDRGESSSNGLKVSQRTADANFETSVAPGSIDGEWHHYALTMDESGISPIFKIYVDGYQTDTGGQSGGIQAFINDYFTIGAYPPGYNFNYQGLMGEMRVSTGILNPAQFLNGPAKLQITAANGHAVISWPQNAGSFTLQQASNLPGTWTALTNNPAVSGLNWQVTVPTTSSAKFYRLFR